LSLDLRSFLAIMSRRRQVIIGGTLLAVLVAAFLSFFVLSPEYEARALLLVTQPTESRPVAEEAAAGAEGAVKTVGRIPVLTMSTYLGQLQSEVLVRRVVDRLNLESRGYTTEDLQKSIDSRIQKDSNLLQVTVRDKDPVTAAEIANTLVNEYLALLSENNQEQMKRSLSFLEDQREDTLQQLAAATQALKEFDSQNRGVAVLDEELKRLSTSLSTNRSRQEALRVEVRQLAAGLERLQEEFTYRYGKQKTLGGEAYNAMVNQMSAAKAELAAKRAELAGVEALVAAIPPQMERIQAELADKKTQRDALQAEVNRLSETLDTLSRKMAETRIAASLDLGQTSVVVVSKAFVPERPVSPNTGVMLLGAFLLGLAGSSGLAMGLHHLDSTLKVPEDVAERLGLPLLAVIPLVATEAAAGVAPETAAADFVQGDAYRPEVVGPHAMEGER
jgi:capsular polysaccharide biosynthesis protein